MDISALSFALEHAYKLTKQLRDADKLAKDATLNMLLADLQNLIADARMEAAALKQQVLDLEAENADLRWIQDTDEKPKGMKWGCYYFDEEKKTPLYCIKCWETERRKSPTNRFASKVRICAVCQTPATR